MKARQARGKLSQPVGGEPLLEERLEGGSPRFQALGTHDEGAGLASSPLDRAQGPHQMTLAPGARVTYFVTKVTE